jgi:hypothetical protein
VGPPVWWRERGNKSFASIICALSPCGYLLMMIAENPVRLQRCGQKDTFEILNHLDFLFSVKDL